MYKDIAIISINTYVNGVKIIPLHEPVPYLDMNFNLWNKEHLEKEKVYFYTAISYLFFSLIGKEKIKYIGIRMVLPNPPNIIGIGPCDDPNLAYFIKDWHSWFLEYHNKHSKFFDNVSIIQIQENNIVSNFFCYQREIGNIWEMCFSIDAEEKEYWYLLDSIKSVEWSLMIMKSYKYKIALLITANEEQEVLTIEEIP